MEKLQTFDLSYFSVNSFNHAKTKIDLDDDFPIQKNTDLA